MAVMYGMIDILESVQSKDYSQAELRIKRSVTSFGLLTHTEWFTGGLREKSKTLEINFVNNMLLSIVPIVFQLYNLKC